MSNSIEKYRLCCEHVADVERKYADAVAHRKAVVAERLAQHKVLGEIQARVDEAERAESRLYYESMAANGRMQARAKIVADEQLTTGAADAQPHPSG